MMTLTREKKPTTTGLNTRWRPSSTRRATTARFNKNRLLPALLLLTVEPTCNAFLLHSDRYSHRLMNRPSFAQPSPVAERTRTNAKGSIEQEDETVTGAQRQQKWTTSSERRRMERKQNKTLYEILRASPDASRAELKRSYIKLARLSHPDAVRNSNDGASVDELDFTEVAAAWRVLSDVKQRKRYDRSLQAEQISDEISSWAETVTTDVVTSVGDTLKAFTNAKDESMKAISNAKESLKVFSRFAQPFIGKKKPSVQTPEYVEETNERYDQRPMEEVDEYFNDEYNGREGIDEQDNLSYTQEWSYEQNYDENWIEASNDEPLGHWDELDGEYYQWGDDWNEAYTNDYEQQLYGQQDEIQANWQQQEQNGAWDTDESTQSMENPYGQDFREWGVDEAWNEEYNSTTNLSTYKDQVDDGSSYEMYSSMEPILDVYQQSESQVVNNGSEEGMRGDYQQDHQEWHGSESNNVDCASAYDQGTNITLVEGMVSNSTSHDNHFSYTSLMPDPSALTKPTHHSKDGLTTKFSLLEEERNVLVVDVPGTIFGERTHRCLIQSLRFALPSKSSAPIVSKSEDKRSTRMKQLYPAILARRSEATPLQSSTEKSTFIETTTPERRHALQARAPRSRDKQDQLFLPATSTVSTRLSHGKSINTASVRATSSKDRSWRKKFQSSAKDENNFDGAGTRALPTSWKDSYFSSIPTGEVDLDPPSVVDTEVEKSDKDAFVLPTNSIASGDLNPSSTYSSHMPHSFPTVEMGTNKGIGMPQPSVTRPSLLKSRKKRRRKPFLSPNSLNPPVLIDDQGLQKQAISSPNPPDVITLIEARFLSKPASQLSTACRRRLTFVNSPSTETTKTTSPPIRADIETPKALLKDPIEVVDEGEAMVKESFRLSLQRSVTPDPNTVRTSTAAAAAMNDFEKEINSDHLGFQEDFEILARDNLSAFVESCTSHLTTTIRNDEEYTSCAISQSSAVDRAMIEEDVDAAAEMMELRPAEGSLKDSLHRSQSLLTPLVGTEVLFDHFVTERSSLVAEPAYNNQRTKEDVSHSTRLFGYRNNMMRGSVEYGDCE